MEMAGAPPGYKGVEMSTSASLGAARSFVGRVWAGNRVGAVWIEGGGGHDVIVPPGDRVFAALEGRSMQG